MLDTERMGPERRMSKEDPLKFTAEVRAIKSMADQTYNITFNVPEYHLNEAQKLMGMLNDMVAIAILILDKKER